MRSFKYIFLLFLSTAICRGHIGQTLAKAMNSTIKRAMAQGRSYATDVSLILSQ